MGPWKKICCAVDLSEYTPHVVRHAAALAGWLQADLVLLHVITPVPVSALDLLPAGDRELTCAVEHELAAWADEAGAAVGRPVSASVAHGQPAREIERFAEANGVDAIVVGTHGRKGLERLVLGSVAELVVRQSTVPVVVVHAPAEHGDRAQPRDAANAAELRSPRPGPSSAGGG